MNVLAESKWLFIVLASGMLACGGPPQGRSDTNMIATDIGKPGETTSVTRLYYISGDTVVEAQCDRTLPLVRSACTSKLRTLEYSKFLELFRTPRVQRMEFLQTLHEELTSQMTALERALISSEGNAAEAIRSEIARITQEKSRLEREQDVARLQLELADEALGTLRETEMVSLVSDGQTFYENIRGQVERIRDISDAASRIDP